MVEAPLHQVVNKVYRSQPSFLPARFHTRLAFWTVALPSVEPCSRLDWTGALPELEQVRGRQFDRLYRPWLPQIQSYTPYRWVIGSTLLFFVHRKRGVSEQVFPIFTKGKQPPCYSAWGACMTRAGSRHGAWDQPLLFLATPATSFNHMFYSGTSPITCFSF